MPRLRPLLLALLPFALAPPAHAQGEASPAPITLLYGTVVDARSGDTLRGATLAGRYSHHQAAVDEGGAYALEVPNQAMPLEVVVAHPGYQPDTLNLDHSQNPQTVRLLPLGAAQPTADPPRRRRCWFRRRG